MRLVSYNVRYGVGADDVVDLQRIARELEGADVIGLQEVDRFWKRGDEVDQAEELARLLGDYYWVYASGLNVDASYRDTENRLVNRRRQHGEMLLSRYPIISTRAYPMPCIGSIARHTYHAILQEAVIGAPAAPFRVYNMHLYYWSPDIAHEQAKFVRRTVLEAPLDGGSWSGDPELMESHWTNGEAPPAMPTSAFVMGDLNNGPGSAVYDEFVGPRGMQSSRAQSLDRFVDPWTWLGNVETDGSTSRFDNKRIDHILVTPDLRHRLRSIHIDDQALGSDHWPVWLELDDIG